MEINGSFYRKNSFIDTLMDFSTFMLISSMFIPQLRILSIYSLIWLGASLLWIFLFFLGKKKYFVKSNFVCLIVFYALLTIVIPVIVDLSVIRNRYIELSIIPLVYWIYDYNARCRGIKSNLRILFLVTPLILYTSIRTLLELFRNPWAVRSIKSEGFESILLLSNGVLGYPLIYSILIIIIALLPLLLYRKKLNLNFKMNVFLILIFTLGAALVVMSNYFTALVVLLISIILIIVLNKKELVLIFLIPIVLIYIIGGNMINGAIVSTLIEMTPQGGKTNDRLKEIKMKLEGKGEMENVDSRSNVTELTYQTILEYPITGYVLGNPNRHFNMNRIGQHSYILDTFAFFGFFVGLFSIYIMINPFYLRWRRQAHYLLKIYALVVGVAFITLILANNLTPSMGFAAFFVFPTIYDYIKIKLDE